MGHFVLSMQEASPGPSVHSMGLENRMRGTLVRPVRRQLATWEESLAMLWCPHLLRS
jgi:hypothetical protein